MKSKDFRKTTTFRNKNGYWQKKNEIDMELKLAIICLVIACAGVALGILTRM